MLLNGKSLNKDNNIKLKEIELVLVKFWHKINYSLHMQELNKINADFEI